MLLTRSEKKLILGTANFGMPYGLGAKEKNLELLEVVDILETVKSQGFLHIDTASSYENSEAIIGNVISKSDNWKITTKLKQSEIKSI
jgi:aryl-alcohol dehydrogenase-like predicted oxidoreductase